MSQTDKFDTKELRSFHAWNERIPEENLELFREAADHIDAQAAEIERLREALTNAEDRMRRVSRLLSEGHQFIDRGDTVKIWADDARAALSGEPT